MSQDEEVNTDANPDEGGANRTFKVDQHKAILALLNQPTGGSSVNHFTTFFSNSN